MQVLVDLCYLTCQRSTNIRDLRWSQVDREAGATHFVSSKTEDSSGEAVDWPITPEIATVLKREDFAGAGATTVDYIKQREVPVSIVRLSLPVA